MHRVLQWMMLALCCVSCATGSQVSAVKWKPDKRLVEAQADYDAAIALVDKGEYSEAFTRAEHALSVKENVLGPRHEGLAQNLSLMGRLYQQKGDFAHSESFMQRALVIREAALSKSHPETEETSLNRIATFFVADALYALANLYSSQRLYDRAEPLYQRALTVTTTTYGERHPVVAISLGQFAGFYLAQNLYDRAEPLYQQALAIQKFSFGESHPNFASSLGQLANLYYLQRLYDRAEPLYQQALAVREAVLRQGPSDINAVSHKKKATLAIAVSLHELANLYYVQGLYSQAEPLYQRALALRETILGKNHLNVAISLDSLGLNHHAQGFYSQAEPLHQRALALIEATLGKNHLDVASSLNHLANNYSSQGLYSQAEPLYQRALALREATLGKNHPAVARLLISLANNYSSQELDSQAEPIHQRALALIETTLGKNHLDVAPSLNSLANIYARQGLYSRAEPLYQRALAIWETTLGKNHPDVAISLNNLATNYSSQGFYNRVEPLYQRALAIREATLGINHPATVSLLDNLARFYLEQRRFEEALPLLVRVLTVSEQRLRHETLEFSESRFSDFLVRFRETEAVVYAQLRAHPQNAKFQRLALSIALLRKGRSAAETAQISRIVYQSLDPEDRITFERLRALRAQLASFSFSNDDSLSTQNSQARYQHLVNEGNEVEARLAQRSAPLRSLYPLPSPEDIVERVAASLPKDGALIEFIAYDDRPLVPQPDMSPNATHILRYLALVLFPDGTTRAVTLGPAKAIDIAATRLRDALAQQDASVQDHAQRLYRFVFQPLVPLLGHTRHLLVSPDSQLNLVPFAALHDGKDFLLSSYDFTYLVSGTQILPRPEVASASSVVVLADPNFSTTSSVLPFNSALRSLSSSEALTHISSRSGWPTSWERLPGTRREAKDIQRLLPQAQLFLDAEATRQRLLQLPAPGILHVATHGFFLGDATSSEDSRGKVFVESLSKPSPKQDPLLNSGLVLSGSMDLGPSSPRLSYSLITALEMAGLNLWGTQLVVLSACDTGLGKVRIGQDVLGLRRALVVAGAETVVMSLWKVKDDSTHLLMDAYYRNLLDGQGRASALREAMRALRASRPHPHHWAPFIALGSDAPLRAITPNTPQPPAVSPPSTP